jgi:hypothetical protein
VSRSMSALNKPEGLREIYTGSESSASASEDGMTPGKESPKVRVGMKRSGTLPSFPSTESLRENPRPREVELPVCRLASLSIRNIADEQNDPKTWTGTLIDSLVDM